MHPLAAAALLTLACALPLAAQDPFEIQVYEYQTVPAGKYNLETHANHTLRGTTAYEGRVAPSEGQSHLTFELTRGFTPWFETALYLVTARGDHSSGDLVGWRFRPRVRLPEHWLPVKVSLSTEVGFPRADYEANAVTLELRPIIERSFGPVLVDLNPTVGRALRGPDAAEGWDFEPGARVAWPASPRVKLSVEYYGAYGVFGDFLPPREQVHQLFPGADFQLRDNVVWNVGVGFGLTDAGNTRVLKMRLGWMFGG